MAQRRESLNMGEFNFIMRDFSNYASYGTA